MHHDGAKSSLPWGPPGAGRCIGKSHLPLGSMTGTWTHVELQLAVEVGYIVVETYVQHHFPQTSLELFRGYTDTFFDIKQRAAAEGNKGLAEIAKLMLNSLTGKQGSILSSNKPPALSRITLSFLLPLGGLQSRQPQHHQVARLTCQCAGAQQALGTCGVQRVYCSIHHWVCSRKTV